MRDNNGMYWTAQLCFFVAIVICVKIGCHDEIPEDSGTFCGLLLAFIICALIHICVKNKEE